MNKTSRVLILALLVVIVALWGWSQCSRRPNALAQYKAKLRAKGEKLTWAEMGYPRPAETNTSLERLEAAVAQLPASAIEPGLVEHMPFTIPGRAQPAWAFAEPRLQPSPHDTNSVTWEEFDSDMQKAGNALAEIRAAVEAPARYYWPDPGSYYVNFPARPNGSFVQKRKAAQWLAADAINASRTGQSERAQADLHALTRLAQMHREELTLVAQMVRAAVAGLALSTTWEALQTNTWNEVTLAALQADWEQVDLVDAVSRGMAGERAFSEAAFTWRRGVSGRESLRPMQIAPGTKGLPQLKSVRDYFAAYVEQPLWRMNSETDELFYLRHQQHSLELLRKLDGTKPWPEIAVELQRHNQALAKLGSNPTDNIRYQISLMAIPNTSRAALVTVRHETFRRLTLTAIALERYRLRHGQPPSQLSALVPDFLSAVPNDLMSGEPLRYRRNADASFVLYSVGEDGRDDGGDASLSSNTNKPDLWSGKDVVWPAAAIRSP